MKIRILGSAAGGGFPHWNCNCLNCPEKTQDLGGCRCHAFMLTGDAANADPVCDKSPHHHLIRATVAKAQRDVGEQPLVFRNWGNSKGMMEKH